MLYMANKRTLTNFDNSVLLISGVLVATSVGQAYFINKKRLDDVR